MYALVFKLRSSKFIRNQKIYFMNIWVKYLEFIKLVLEYFGQTATGSISAVNNQVLYKVLACQWRPTP